MPNWASTSYRIEGPPETLQKIKKAIDKALPDKDHYTEYKACEFLGFPEEELKWARLGGSIDEEPSLGESTLGFYAEERWSLQDFHKLLEKHFPDIKVYWVVEEQGLEVYFTNDGEGKYFPDRYWVDTALDDNYQSEYFITEEAMYEWLSKITNGRVKSKEDVERFNADYEATGDKCENFIYIYEFEVVE